MSSTRRLPWREMKRLVVFWILAAGVGAGAAITTVEQGERDPESVAAAERTASAEPTADDDRVTVVENDGEGATTKRVGTKTERAKQKAQRAEQQKVKRSPEKASGTSTAEPTPDPTTWRDAPAADAAQCPGTSRGIVVDRQWQRAWLCADGAIATVFPITSAASQPDPGTYPIYALDYQSYSNFGDAPSTLDRFVAFTYGKYQGARIAFHAVPYYADGSLAQPLESVGELGRFGETSGCIRVLPDHAELIYGTMQVGDDVRVIS